MMKESLQLDEETRFRRFGLLRKMDFWTRKRMRKTKGRTCTEMLGL